MEMNSAINENLNSNANKLNQTISKISNQIKKNTNTNVFPLSFISFNNRDFHYLSTILQVDEEIKCAIKYARADMHGINSKMICTNKRLIFFYTGLFGNSNSSIFIEKIDSIETNTNSIHIHYGSNTKSLYQLSSDDTIKFSNIINEQIDSYKTIKIQTTQITEENFIDQISRLADLYKNGTLTEYEFSMKKQELLNKINQK